jgi:hypothetical protein
MASIDTLVCANNCESELPIAEFSQCAPELLQAQVSMVYLANDGYALTDWSDPAEWASRISNISTLPNAIREMTVIASIADPTVTEKKISGGRTIYSPQEFTIAGRIDDNSDTNYDFMRATGCNRQYRMWYGTLGSKLYGGNAGILTNLRMWETIAEDDLEYAVLNLQLKWKAAFAPLRIDNPMA